MEIKTNITNSILGTCALMEKSTTAECMEMSINDLAKACREYQSETLGNRQANFSKYYSALFIKMAKYMPNMFYNFDKVLADDVVMTLNESLMRCLETWKEGRASFKTFAWGDFRFGMIRQQRLANMKKRRFMQNYVSIQSKSEDNVYIISDISDERLPSEFDLNLEMDTRFTKKEKTLILLLANGCSKREVRARMGISIYKFKGMMAKVKDALSKDF